MPKKADLRPKNRARTYIKAWRNFRNLTLEELAAQLQIRERYSITDGQLSRIERGESPYSQDLLEPMARVLRCTVDQLISRPPRVGIDEGPPLTPEEERQVAAFVQAIRSTNADGNR